MTFKKEGLFFAYQNGINLYQMIEKHGEEFVREFLEGLTDAEAHLLYSDPYFTLRTKQIIPNDGREGTLALTGRGFGKTHMMSVWANIRAFEEKGPILIAAKTAADLRDTVIEIGPSSIIETAPEGFKPTYYASKRTLVWPNGQVAFARSGDEPEQFRGQNTQTVICDEFASWDAMDESWSNIMFGLRFGDDPQFLIATTPRSKPLIKRMFKDDNVVKVTGSSTENLGNLDKRRLDAMYREYGNTTRGKQELEGHIIWEDDGALWKQETIDRFRMPAPGNVLQWRIGVDPTTGSGKKRNDEAGIIVACSAMVGEDKHAFVVADYSVKGGPEVWAKAVKEALDFYPKSQIIVESNQGGEMIIQVLQNAGIPSGKVRLKHHMRSKYDRAQPVALKAEQGYVHHSGMFTVLEEEMTTFTGEPGEKSPNRLDAKVMAVHDLIVDNRPTLTSGPMGI